MMNNDDICIINKEKEKGMGLDKGEEFETKKSG